jgi:DNA-binding MarR family transcriptional regulator
MDKVAVSRAVAGLMKDGRVKRGIADHDKRESVLRLTARGWKIFDEVAPLARAHERRLLAHLEEREQEWLSRILDKLLAAEREIAAE